MKQLVVYAWVFLVAAIIIAAALAALLMLQPPLLALFALPLFAVGTAALLLFITTRKKVSAAQAIVDSAVIHIPTAVIYGQASEESKKPREDYSIYVSSFGILFGAKVVRFNQGGIWLREVEIGRDYISFAYGASNGELERIRLFYAKPGEDELASIIENFRKDTGVVPVIA